MGKRWTYGIVLALMGLTFQGAAVPAWVGDCDESGYVDLVDYHSFGECFGYAGPRDEMPPACRQYFDADDDGDIDLKDYAAFQRARGHTPIPLKDYWGNTISIDSADPYSGRATCGATGCHDTDVVTNGFLFEQGRTDVNGQVDMGDDYYGDGRYWIKSSGRYGKWGQTFRFLLASKENDDASAMEQTTFAWVRDCSSCHPGGGPAEFDRDDQLLYNAVTEEFGYELLNKTAEEVALDGDYSVIDYSTGSASPAPWNITGVSGPDCLRCHRAQRTVIDGNDMNFIWRQNALAAGAGLVDAEGSPVPAFAAAGTAGQGWFSSPTKGAARMEYDGRDPFGVIGAAFLGEDSADSERDTVRAVLQIDYQAGVDDGSLMIDAGDTVYLRPESVTYPPKDRACWGCHPYGTITGTVWFDDSNVHYRKFNHLNDADPRNDVPPEESRVCTVCHIGDIHHNFGRGNSPQIHYRDELDWQNMRNCRRCHMPQIIPGVPNPWKHPDAPDVPGPGDVMIHIAEPFEILSCQACHIPYSIAPAVLLRDITMPGTKGTTSQYYSSNPLDPTEPREPGNERWYPAFCWKTDLDGVQRLFPCSIWIAAYWANWNQQGTPEDKNDDLIAPIPTTQIYRLIPEPLSVVTDDNGDGELEVNRAEEILAYLDILTALVENPVLVRGKRVWYADAAAPEGVGFFEHGDTGIPIERYPYIWGKDHNVRPKEESWGYTPDPWPGQGCRDCHRADTLDSPVFHRLILVDPYGLDGQPVYETVSSMTGLFLYPHTAE